MDQDDSLLESSTRRALVGAALCGVGLLALGSLPAARAIAAEARKNTSLRFFSADEAAIVDAVTALVIPTDDTPGAREMGVLAFIDQALAGAFAPLATDFRSGLADFEARCRSAHAGGFGFASLPLEQQLQWLHATERTPFFQLVQQLTVLGALSMPEHGGNHDGLGWQLIGFEDMHAFEPPFGYYDRDYPGFETGGSTG